jgi:hypothetical protein
MALPELESIGASLYWSYANLAMAHADLADGASTYQRKHFMIRARLFRGLREHSMDVGSLVDDDRVKMLAADACCYCGGRVGLTVDHLIPKYRGGPDVADNIVWCCRRCNSSKGTADVLDWYAARNEFPPLLLLRRYLKLAIEYCDKEGIVDLRIEGDQSLNLPFALRAVPLEFPLPGQLQLWSVPLVDRRL